jgi:hypothetical protein
LPAWCGGTIGTMTQVSVNLGGDVDLLNKTVQIRWHEGNDSGTVSTGWYVDSVVVSNAQVAGVCTAGSSGPSPVTSTGTNAAKFTKNPNGNTLKVTYDASSCSFQKAILLYGTIGSYTGDPTPYVGCADSNLGNTGSDTAVNASTLNNVWFNILWTNGTTAGHPGFAFNGTSNVARTWAVGSLCGMAADDQSKSTCP